MAEALYTQDDYTQALLSLLPRGRAWPKDPGSVQAMVMAALALGLVRLDGRAQTLLTDNPSQTVLELIPEWEKTLGLPDPCDGPTPTLEQRRTSIVSRLANAGGQSKPYFLAVLARLGYPDATITEYAPFRAGVSHTGDPLTGTDWWFHWTINLPELNVIYFRANVSTAGEPLLTVSDTTVTCVIDELRPAHTTVDFTANP